jgi:beta-glucosidase
MKLLVAGPAADVLSPLNSGWTITWQGNEESLFPKNKNTIFRAIREKAGSSNVIYSQGSSFDSETDIQDAVDKAAGVDAIILCLGEKAYCETPGNIDDLTLDEAQLKLAEALIRTGRPVILVMIEGRPRVIRKIVDGSKGIIIGFLPGMEGGTAIADVLFGDVNPSGKLPVTYPKYPNAVYHYDYKPLEFFDTNTYDPQWPFGYGMSYTTFSYSDMKLDRKKIKMNEDVKVSVTVKNTGKLPGKEAVLLYLTDMYGSVSRPVKQLQGFEKISLKAGESRVVEFTIKPDQLSFIGRDNKRITEPGEFMVTISDLSNNFWLE